MSSVAEHQAAIRDLLHPLSARASERRRTDRPQPNLAPRVLARDVVSPIDLPPFDNSQMDGYAVSASQIIPGVPLGVAARIPAGHGVDLLQPGSAAPIMTGAPVPDGADAVIPIENSTPNEFQPELGEHLVSFDAAPQAGAFVRRRGSDLRAGSVLLPKGTVLGPAQWGVLASAGVTEIELIRQLRVLVLSTGSELTLVGHPLDGGHVYDANGASMVAALAETGAHVTEVLIVNDDPRLLRAVFTNGEHKVDLVLSTGGVSTGDYEVVRDVFEPAGVAFGTVAMQPGGPQGLGTATLDRFNAPMVAFPGNPVSALVSFEMFLRPVLRELHGLRPNRRAWFAPLAEPIDSPTAKHQVRRGRLNAAGQVELIGGPGSHLLHSYALSTVLIHIPVGIAHLDAGDSVEVWSINE